MNQKEFVEKYNVTIDDDSCKICTIHDEGHKHLKSPICPHCNGPIYNIEYEWSNADWHVITDTNGYCPSEKINYAPTDICRSCGERVVFYPEPILYNGNHDIWYTGGSKYVPNIEVKDFIKDNFLKLINQFVERRDAGEKLDTKYLDMWLTYEAERILAEILTKHYGKV